MAYKVPSQVLADEAEAELLGSGIYVLPKDDPTVALGLLWDIQNRYPGAQIRKYRGAGGGYVFEASDRLGTVPSENDATDYLTDD